MCFGILWFIQLVIFIAFVVLVVTVMKIWLPAWRTADGQPVISGPLLATLRAVIGFIIFCFIVWLLYDLYVCFVGSGGLLGPRIR